MQTAPIALAEYGVLPVQREAARGQLEAVRPRRPLEPYEFPPDTLKVAPIAQFVAWLRETGQIRFVGEREVQLAYWEFQLITGTRGMAKQKFRTAFNTFAKRKRKAFKGRGKLMVYQLRSASIVRLVA